MFYLLSRKERLIYVGISLENIITPSVSARRGLEPRRVHLPDLVCRRKMMKYVSFLAGGGAGGKAGDRHQREEGNEAEQELGSAVDEGEENHQLQVRDASPGFRFVLVG